MGGTFSKRKFSIKRNKQRKREKNETANEETENMYEEPYYMEIGLERDDLTTESSLSRDSAFSDRCSSLNVSRTSSLALYDVPRVSMYGHKDSYLTYEDQPKTRVDHGSTCTYDFEASCDGASYSDDVDDDHTYISDVSLRQTVSSGISTLRCGSIVPLEDVPYMVEAFQPLLEQTIDVIEILPHLPFIDAHAFVKIDDQRKAVELFIARIKASDEPGKWQAFLHALNLTEYEYIVSLLRGKTEKDHSVNRDLLRLFTPQIMQRIDPEEFIDHLFEKRVINERDMEEVRCEKERRGAIAASFMLLHKVPRRNCNWFEVFLDVLSNCGMDDLVKHLQIPEVSVCTRLPEKHEPSFSRSTKASSRFPVKPTTSLTRTKKKRLRGAARSRLDPDQDYLTPIYNAVPDLPPRNPNQLITRHVPESFMEDVIPKQARSTNETTLKLETDTERELKLLQEKKDFLQKQVQEKKLIKQLNKEVKDLQKELEVLNSGKEDEGTKGAAKLLNETDFEDNVTHLPDAETENFETDNKKNDDKLNGNSGDVSEQDIEKHIVNVEKKESDQETRDTYINFDDAIARQLRHEQHITELLTDMRNGLKEDILAMRDHVTDAVFKSIVSLASRPASLEENAYVTVEPEQTILPLPVKLFSNRNRQYSGVLCPKSHYTQKLYDDSAIFSDYNSVLYM